MYVVIAKDEEATEKRNMDNTPGLAQTNSKVVLGLGLNSLLLRLSRGQREQQLDIVLGFYKGM